MDGSPLIVAQSEWRVIRPEDRGSESRNRLIVAHSLSGVYHEPTSRPGRSVCQSQRKRDGRLPDLASHLGYNRRQRRPTLMRSDGKAEVQHYVLQVLLRLHASDPSAKKGSEQIWCFDKQGDKIFPANIRGVLAGTRFYEVEVDGQTLSLEESLSEIEGRLGPILARLVGEQKLATLTEQDRYTIANFCAVQMLRTQVFRDRIRDLNEGVAGALRKRGIDPSEVSNFKILSDDEIKAFSMNMLADGARKYGPHFVSKYWHLIGSTRDDPFHVGDHPVVVDNDFGRGPGTLGLASAGVTIYLPLSPTLCLGMTDPALIEDLFEGAGKVRAGCEAFEKKIEADGFPAKGMGLLKMMQESRDRVNQQIAPMEAGTPSAHEPQVVTRVNSLQMLNAGRWIISSKPDFSLPLKMLADNPGFRERRKLEVE
jgi:hypothetical protein